jgi:valyl-tRNA synthetase
VNGLPPHDLEVLKLLLHAEQFEVEKIRVEIEKVSQKLSNPNFAQKVPPKVLEEHHQRLADWNAKHAQTLAALEEMGRGGNVES